MSTVITGTSVTTGVVKQTARPIFSAVAAAATSMTSATAVKLLCATEEYDTAACYNPALSRFTPNVAGYYKVLGGFNLNTAVTSVSLMVYKNGTQFKFMSADNSGASAGTYGECIVYLNGTTDYVELFAIQGAATQNNVVSQTWFQGYLLEATP